jgi:uncharacterized protein (DUF433 family)
MMMNTQTATRENERTKNRRLRSNTYPHIMCNPKILGGKPIIAGTRIAVATIAGYYQLGMSVDEILIALEHLSPSEIHSALAYYFEHSEEIDGQIANEKNVEQWKKQAHIHPKATVR